jgi:hypothetical protein
MQIDASISTSFETTPSICMEALVFWRYDAKYKEVRINIDNNDKKYGSSRKRAKRQKRIMITRKEASTKSELTDYIKFHSHYIK